MNFFRVNIGCDSVILYFINRKKALVLVLILAPILKAHEQRELIKSKDSGKIYLYYIAQGYISVIRNDLVLQLTGVGLKNIGYYVGYLNSWHK